MEYKVSKETAELVRAYDLLAEVTNHLYMGLSVMFSDIEVEALIEGKITPHILALQSEVMDWVSSSIMDNRGVLQSDEI